MAEIVKPLKVKSKERADKDEYIGDTFGEWYNCGENEYVYDGMIFRKKFVEVEKDSCVFFNPVTGKYSDGSPYLFETFKDNPKTLWIANMVTFMRHQLKSYESSYQNSKYANKIPYYDYDEYKAMVNERQKRNIAKKFTALLKEHNITVEDVKLLQGTTEETIKVWTKKGLV